MLSPLVFDLTCPHCGSNDVHRSRRRIWYQYALSWFGVLPYRCHDCNSVLIGLHSRNHTRHGDPNDTSAF